MRAGRPGPPVEVGVRPDGLRIEPSAALGDDGLEVGERGEVPIDGGLVDQGPEVLGRQEYQADPVGYGEAIGAMPAGIVEHQDDVALPARTGLPSKGGEQFREEGL